MQVCIFQKVIKEKMVKDCFKLNERTVFSSWTFLVISIAMFAALHFKISYKCVKLTLIITEAVI